MPRGGHLALWAVAVCAVALGGCASLNVEGDGGGSGTPNPSPFPSGTPMGGFTVVQAASLSTSANVSGVTATFPRAVTSGDLIVAALGWSDDFACPSLKDDKGNSYFQVTQRSTPGSRAVSIFYGSATRGGGRHVTMGLDSPAAASLLVLEISSAGTASPLDAVNGRSGQSNEPSCGSVVPSMPGELVFGALYLDGKETVSPAAEYHLEPVGPMAGEYRFDPADASTQVAFSLSASGGFACVAATFR